MDQSVLTTPHGFSQLITSFFGSQCQGIRPALFFALPFVQCIFLSSHYATCSLLFINLPDKKIFSIVTRSILIFALLLLYSVFKFLLCS